MVLIGSMRHFNWLITVVRDLVPVATPSSTLMGAIYDIQSQGLPAWLSTGRGLSQNGGGLARDVTIH